MNHKLLQFLRHIFELLNFFSSTTKHPISVAYISEAKISEHQQTASLADAVTAAATAEAAIKTSTKTKTIKENNQQEQQYVRMHELIHTSNCNTQRWWWRLQIPVHSSGIDMCKRSIAGPPRFVSCRYEWNWALEFLYLSST